MLSVVFRYWLAPRLRVPAALGVIKNARKDTKTRSLCPPSGGDFVPPSCADRAQFLRFSVLQKLYAIKKLEVQGHASADCTKPRSARPGSARPRSAVMI